MRQRVGASIRVWVSACLLVVNLAVAVPPPAFAAGSSADFVVGPADPFGAMPVDETPPVFDAVGDKSVDEGSTLTFTVSATDADGEPITYSAENLPSGAVFDAATATFSWTPTYGQAGSYPDVTFSASDGTAVDSESITITVNDVSVPDPVVDFPDANLEAAVRAALEIPSGSIYESDMLELTTLDAPSRGIVDLQGLGYATNLVHLDLADNEIRDLSPVAGLSMLQWLSLSGNLVSDVAPLAGMNSNLRMLSLVDNQVADISTLSSLSALRHLYLSNNTLTDLGPLAALGGLNDLSIASNGVTDIGPLEGLSQLSYLDAGDNAISDIAPLAGLTRISWIDLGGNQIDDISPLAGMTWMRHLGLANNRITDISVLQNMPSLYWVPLQGNYIQDITPLVLNAGLGADDTVSIWWNYLDLTSGSAAMAGIDALVARGTTVYYDPQRPRPVTTVTLAPQSPGPNGWYVLTPSIAVTAQHATSTYYQWDSDSPSGWLTYSEPFDAAEGEHTLYVYSTNVDGIAEPVHSLTIKVDTEAPGAPGIDDATDPVNAINVLAANVSGHAEADAQITVTVSDGDTALGFGTTANGGVWSLTGLDLSILADGPITYAVRATDAAGNASSSTERVAIKDATAPTAPTLSGNLDINQFYAAAMPFGGSAEPGSIVTVLVTDELGNNPWAERVVAGTDGSWSVLINCSSLIDGTIAYLVTAADTAGNTSPETTASGVKDTVPPESPLITQVGGINRDNVENVHVAGTGTPGTMLVLVVTGPNGTESGGAADVDDAGDWYVEFDASMIEDGPINYKAFAVDEYHNGSASALAGPMKKDTIAPLLSVNEPPLVSLANVAAVPVGGMSEPGVAITVTVADAAGGQSVEAGVAQPDGSFAWGIDLTALDDGDITYVVSAADASGNRVQVTMTSYKDTAAPDAPVFTSAPEITLANLGAVPVAGTAEVGSFVAVEVTDYRGTTAFGSATADGDGNWTMTIDCTGLADGTITYSAQATDAADNASGVGTANAAKDTALPNSSPSVSSPTLTFTENSELMLAPSDLGSDAEGDELTIEIVEGPAHGTLQVLPDGSARYAPSAYYCGDDSFTYRLSDGLLSSETGTATLHGLSVNYPPTATMGLQATSERGEQVSITLSGADVDGDGLFFAISVPPMHGTVMLAGAHALYTPTPGYSGPDSFAFYVSDGSLMSSPAAVALTVTGAPVNTGPVITSVSGPAAPVGLGGTVALRASFTDQDIDDSHTALFAWDDGTTSYGSVASGVANASHTYTTPGVYAAKVTITDTGGASATATFDFLVVYDPNGGFVTGGGWIASPAGACPADPTLTGKANFGFVSKYKKGQTVPAGDTEFQFHAAGLNFKSTAYEWLVISGKKAQFKGEGTVNGAGQFKFMVTAVDGSPDLFRIKISDKITGVVLYDNQLGAADTATPVTTLGGGAIIVHK